MTSICIASGSMMRTTLSVAIVAMVGTVSSNSTAPDVCPTSDHQEDSDNMPGDFPWDEETQGLILGSFFYGSAVSHIPLGRLGEVYGARLSLGLMTVVDSLCSLLTPLSASTSTGLFISLRVINGLAMGGLLPTVNAMIPTWFPPEERSKFTSLIMTGSNLGTVVSMSLTGWLCEAGWLGGWPAAFYVLGTAGMVLSALWFLLVHSFPEDHPRISPQELHYILTARGDVKERKAVRVPWRAILKSPWVWIVTVVAMGDSFGFYTLLTEIPTYLANIQRFGLADAGLSAALPYMASLVVSTVWGYTVGWLSKTHSLSTRRIRQLSVALGLCIPAVCLVGMCLVGCRARAAVAVLAVAVASTSFSYAGYFCSHQDLAPNFAGTLLGLTNALSTLMGVLAPAVTGAITNNNQTLGAWRAVFLVAAALYVFMAALFITFTPVRVQPWNFPSTPQDLAKGGVQ